MRWGEWERERETEKVKWKYNLKLKLWKRMPSERRHVHTQQRTRNMKKKEWKQFVQPLELSFHYIEYGITGSAMHFLCAKRLRCCFMSLLPSSSLSYPESLRFTMHFTTAILCQILYVFFSFLMLSFSLCVWVFWNIFDVLKRTCWLHCERITAISNSWDADSRTHTHSHRQPQPRFMRKNIRLWHLRCMNIWLNITNNSISVRFLFCWKCSLNQKWFANRLHSLYLLIHLHLHRLTLSHIYIYTSVHPFIHPSNNYCYFVWLFLLNSISNQTKYRDNGGRKQKLLNDLCIRSLSPISSILH